MVGRVGKLADRRSTNRQGLSSDQNRAVQVVVAQTVKFIRDKLPPGGPTCHQRLTRVTRFQNKFGISEPIWLLAVTRQEVRPPGSEVPSEVLDKDRRAVGIRAGLTEERVIIETRQGALRNASIPPKLLAEACDGGLDLSPPGAGSTSFRPKMWRSPVCGANRTSADQSYASKNSGVHRVVGQRVGSCGACCVDARLASGIHLGFLEIRSGDPWSGGIRGASGSTSSSERVEPSPVVGRGSGGPGSLVEERPATPSTEARAGAESLASEASQAAILGQYE